MAGGGGRCRFRWRMRCSQGKKGCGSRFTLKRHPSKYKREIKCPNCGSTHLQDVEAERQRERARQDTCYCMQYPFPHRAGSLRFCEQNPNDAEVTEEEYYDFIATWNTGRTG